MSSQKNPLDECLEANEQANVQLCHALHTAEETTRFHVKKEEPVEEDAPVTHKRVPKKSVVPQIRRKRPVAEPEATLRIVPHAQDAGSAATA